MTLFLFMRLRSCIHTTFSICRIPSLILQEDRYWHSDPDGRQFADDNLNAKGLQGGGDPYEYKGVTSLWRVPLDKMKTLDSENRLYLTNRRGVRIKRFHDEMKGVPVNDLWTDIAPVNSQAKEAAKYPAQKPLALLERIIKASSNPNDVVLDPFCGCATTCVAAERLNRQWIGMDVSFKAYELVKERLTKEAANPEDLFKCQNEIHMRTDPPPRTDWAVGYREKKFVYVISHPACPGEYKVGIAKNWKSRLNACQTPDPDWQYKIEFKLRDAFVSRD